MQRMDMNGNVMVVNGDTSLNQLAMPLNPTVFVPNREYSTSANPSNNIVEQFVLFRRRITYERLQSHYKEPQVCMESIANKQLTTLSIIKLNFFHTAR